MKITSSYSTICVIISLPVAVVFGVTSYTFCRIIDDFTNSETGSLGFDTSFFVVNIVTVIICKRKELMVLKVKLCITTRLVCLAHNELLHCSVFVYWRMNWKSSLYPMETGHLHLWVHLLRKWKRQLWIHRSRQKDSGRPHCEYRNDNSGCPNGLFLQSWRLKMYIHIDKSRM